MKILSSSFFKKIFINKKILFFVLFFLMLPAFSFVTAQKNMSVSEWFSGGIENIVGTIMLGIVTVFSLIFMLAAVIFDNLLAIGLSPAFFNLPFIEKAWSEIRDFANIFFIFGFLYIAFQVMVGKNNQWQGAFIKIIIVALVINFSLFLSKGIVDVGNMTARVFYNSIGQEHQMTVDGSQNNFSDNYFLIAEQFHANTNAGEHQFRSIAGYFQSFVKPEKIFGSNTFEVWQKEHDGNIWMYVFMSILVSVYFILLSKTFFQGGFFFLTRIIYLIFYIIISPLALIAMFIPKMEQYWSQWLAKILSRSFCITVYLFFIWLAALIMKSGITKIDQQDDFWLIMSAFVFQGIIVYMILDMATKQGGKLCGDAGGVLQGLIVGAIMKLPVGKLLKGIGGKTARTGLQHFGRKIYQSKTLQKGIEDGNWASRWGASKMKLYGDKMTKEKIYGLSGKDAMDKKTKEKLHIAGTITDEKKKSQYLAKVSGGVDYNKINTENGYQGFTSQKNLNAFLGELKDEGVNVDLNAHNGDLLAALNSNSSGDNKAKINEVLSGHTEKVSITKNTSIMSALTGDIHGKLEEDKAKETKREKTTEEKKDLAQEIKQESAKEIDKIDKNVSVINTLDSTNIEVSNLNEVTRALKDLSDDHTLPASTRQELQKLRTEKGTLQTLNATLSHIKTSSDLNKLDDIKEELDMLKAMKDRGASTTSIKERENEIHLQAQNLDDLSETKNFLRSKNIDINASPKELVKAILDLKQNLQEVQKNAINRTEGRIKQSQSRIEQATKSIQKTSQNLARNKKVNIKAAAEFDTGKAVGDYKFNDTTTAAPEEKVDK